MNTIKFLKDGSNRIKLNGVLYTPKTLEQLLNIPTAFYAKVEVEDEDENVELVKGPTTKWFNYKGLTYIRE